MSELPEVSFDYAGLMVPNRVRLQTITNEIREHGHSAVISVIAIGSRLLVVKAMLDRGQFLTWLDAEFNWTERSAQRMMLVAEQFGGKGGSGVNAATSALYLLTDGSTPESVKTKLIPRVIGGEPITGAEVRSEVRKSREPKPQKAQNDTVSYKPQPVTVKRVTPEVAPQNDAPVCPELSRTQRKPDPEPKPAIYPDGLPEHLRPVFDEAVRFDQILAHLTQVKKLYDELTGGSEASGKPKPMACATALAKDFQAGMKHIQDLRHFISSRRPTNICPYCRGDEKKSAKCTACAGGGWSTAFQWRTSSDNQKKNPNWNKP